MRPTTTQQDLTPAERVARRRAKPIEYRLHREEPVRSAASVRPTAAEPEQTEDDYTPFMMSMLGTAVVMFAIQAIGAVIIANWIGAQVSLKVALYVLPYVEILASPTDFMRIATWSTVVTVIAVSLRSLTALAMRRGEIQVIDGRATGLLMAGVLLIMQLIRHRLGPPLIDTWIVGQSAASLIAATVIYLGFRPDDRSVAPERPTRRASSSRRETPNRTRNKKEHQP